MFKSLFSKKIRLKGGAVTLDRRLDRVKEFDERSRAFPIRTLVEDKKLKSRVWACDEFYDQGREGACVGYSWSHELAARPIVKRDPLMALKIYTRARQLDSWPGEDYSGTSVLAGAKAVQELKNKKGESVMPEYRWAFSLEDFLLALGNHGPGVLGLNWYEGMFDTDSEGFIRVSGKLSGGHAICAVGVRLFTKEGRTREYDKLDFDKSYVILHNSWGTTWGQGGRCKISLTDLQRLLNEDGEAAIPVLRK